MKKTPTTGQNIATLITGIIMMIVGIVYYNTWDNGYYIITDAYRAAKSRDPMIAIILIIIGIIISVIGARRLMKGTSSNGSQNRTHPHPACNANANANAYSYLDCPSCGKKLRIQAVKGRVSVTCPICKNTFIHNF